MLASFEIPSGVTVEKSGNDLVVKGPKGELKKCLENPGVKIDISEGKIIFSSDSDRRKTRAILGAYRSVMVNMIKGVTKGWECRLKVVHSHFPPKVSAKGNEVIIQNFLGERKSRTAEISEGVDVKVDKDLIIITGMDKEKVGQVGANIEKATKIRGFDRRIFQDGCYIISKPGD